MNRILICIRISLIGIDNIDRSIDIDIGIGICIGYATVSYYILLLVEYISNALTTLRKQKHFTSSHWKLPIT